MRALQVFTRRTAFWPCSAQRKDSHFNRRNRFRSRPILMSWFLDQNEINSEIMCSRNDQGPSGAKKGQFKLRGQIPSFSFPLVPFSIQRRSMGAANTKVNLPKKSLRDYHKWQTKTREGLQDTVKLRVPNHLSLSSPSFPCPSSPVPLRNFNALYYLFYVFSMRKGLIARFSTFENPRPFWFHFRLGPILSLLPLIMVSRPLFGVYYHRYISFSRKYSISMMKERKEVFPKTTSFDTSPIASRSLERRMETSFPIHWRPTSSPLIKRRRNIRKMFWCVFYDRSRFGLFFRIKSP